MQLKDNTSETDSNEIDTELIPDTTDTISNTENETEDNTTNDIADSESRPNTPTSDDICHFIEQQLLSLDPLATMALGMLEYHSNFYPEYVNPEKEGSFGKTLYKKSPPGQESADELGLVFFGEVCSSFYGTAITAKGNHYIGNPGNPKVSKNHF